MSTPEQLFERFRSQADPAALAAVFDALAPELLLVAGHLAAGEGEDLVQVTFLDAIEHRNRWDASRPLLPWLLGILTNNARAGRRERARRHRLAGGAQREEPSPLEQLASAEVQEQLAVTIRSMPRTLRTVATMRLVHGLTPTEIAHTLGCPIATVKTRLQRGREWLRQALPTGIALGSGALLSGGSLVAARAVVVAKADAVTAAMTAAGAGGIVSTIAVVGGGLVMKKVAVSVGALLVLACAGWLLPRFFAHEPTAPPAGSRAVAVQGAGDRGEGAAGAGPRAAAAEDPSVTRVAVAAAVGAVEFQFVWRGEGTAAPGLVVNLARDRAGVDILSERIAGRADDAGVLRVGDLPAGRYQVWGEAQHTFDVAAGQVLRERVEVEPYVCVAGVVHDRAGRPVSGARICLTSARSLQDPVQPMTLATTDAEGRFRVCWCNGGRIWARKPGYAASRAEFAAKGEQRDVRLVLDGSHGEVRGSVRATSAEPVVGALVVILAVGRRDSPVQPILVRTDAAGRFSSDEVVPGEQTIVVCGSGFAPARLDTTCAAGVPRDIDVRVTPGATVFGRVTTTSPAPSLVRCSPAWALDSLAEPYVETAVAVDARGGYRLENVPVGEVVVDVREIADSRRRLVAAEGEEHRCDFGESARIVGRLVDRDDAPLADWWVFAYSERTGAGNPTTVRGDGRFVFADLAGDSYRIAAMPTAVPSSQPWLEVRNVRPGEGELLLRARHTLAEAAHVVGVLRDAQARPLEDAVFFQRPEGTDASWRRADVKIDATGRFEAGPFPPDRLELSVLVPGLGHLLLGTQVLPPGGRVDLGTIEMPGAGALAVVLICAERGAVRAPELRASDRAGNFAARFEHGDDGVHRATGLPAGDYRLTVWGEDFAPAERQVDVVADQVTEHRVPLTPAPTVTFAFVRSGVGGDARWTAGVMFGVETATGVPVASRWIAVDTKGAFAWRRGLLPGDYRFKAEEGASGQVVRGGFVVGAEGGGEVRVELPPR